MAVETISDLGKRPLIMGIVNVTPDSFSGDGVLADAAAAQAVRMLEEGADILDVGGESSRPGAAPVSLEEELKRVLPAIEAIKKAHPAAVISVDTVKAKVAEAALAAGASIINDISALGDDAMGGVVAASGAYVVLMHNRAGTAVEESYEAPHYVDLIEDVANDLALCIEAALIAGVAADRIVADPGLGFGKNPAQNCALINRLDKLKAKLGCPMLIGPSRKSFIGKILDLPVEERLEGTLAAVTVGVMRGANILRVHDVKSAARAARMAAALKAA